MKGPDDLLPDSSRLPVIPSTRHTSARISFVFLWLSQVSRVLADHCLRGFVVLQAAREGVKAGEAAWHQVTVFFVLPFILLAPVNGALSNSLPKRWVLAGASAWCLAVTLLVGLLVGTEQSSWWWCVGLALSMIGAAVYSPARYGLLPAVAEDTQLSLPRVNGWIEMGSAAALVGGLALGWELHGQSGTVLGFAPALAAVLGLNIVSALAALLVHFPSDPRRPEPAAAAVAGFFRDYRRIMADPDARSGLLGIAFFMALTMAGGGAVLAHTGALQDAAQGIKVLVDAIIMVGIGAAVGSLLAAVQGHPFRSLGLVSWGATGMIAALVWAVLSSDLTGPALVLGFMAGMVNVPLRAAYQAAVPADARGNAMAVSNTANYLLMIALSLLMVALVRLNILEPWGQLALLALLAAAAALAAWVVLLRPTIELLTEIVLWPVFRIHGHGPGLHQVPLQGPCIIIGNHAAWFDPMWVAKVAPRALIPMMTSDFYDLPVIRQLMKIVGTIRVQSARFRRQAPELDQAVKVLEEGGCVLLFPEGWMRRKEEMLLRPFGQGIWHILRRRPNTPVVCCWIDGGWGSYASYKDGPPTKNKRLDFWRRIDIAFEEPIIVPAEVLAEHRSTRTFLWRRVMETRKYLGLEVPQVEAPVEEKEEADEPA